MKIRKLASPMLRKEIEELENRKKTRAYPKPETKNIGHDTGEEGKHNNSSDV